MKKILLSILLLLPSSVLFAQATVTIPSEHPSLYRGVRQLGMGNASVAMPGLDEAAPFYNPASIPDYEKKVRFRILSPVGDFSPSSIGMIKDIFNLADDLDAQSGDAAAQTDTFEAFVDQHIGEFHSIDFRMPIISMMHQWFFVSLLADSRNTFSFRNRTFTNVEMLSRSDGGGMIGGGYSFFEDRLQAGLTVKVLHRLLVSEVVTTGEIISQPDFGDVIDLKRGTGVGVDVGVKGQIPTWNLKALDYLKPTAGVTWQDIADTRFSGGAGRTKQSVSTGIAIHPTHQFWSRDWESHFAVDFREINQSTSFPKKLFFGYELRGPLFGFFRPSLRVGANQLYVAGGVTLDFKIAKLEFATYGEEAGLSSRQKQIRKIAGNLSFGF